MSVRKICGAIVRDEKEFDIRKIDAIIANHGECDHSGSLTALMSEIPNASTYCTANAVKSIEGQYGKRGWDFHVVKTGDTLDIGNGKQLVFVEMRMLHWPFAPLLTKKLEEIAKLNLPIEIITTSHGAIWRENPIRKFLGRVRLQW